jgi:hypothetical protein|tara:strand:- start:67 stop:498 length:432 start_codon:yes stop_codon:yes gene_type:complete
VLAKNPRHWLRGLGLAVLGLLAGSCGAGAGERSITGTVDVAADLAHNVVPGDRLILSIHHPRDGIAMDAKFMIIPDFTLPLEFQISATIDMNGRTQWRDYVVEAFTDKDGDVLSVAPGEVLGRTPETVPLGTTGLNLILDRSR